MKKIYFVLICFTFIVSLNAQTYNNAFRIQSAGTDRGMGISSDNTGNIISTGYFGGTADFDPAAGSASLTPNGTGEDVYIAKYDAALNFMWAVKFGNSGSDFSYALDIDASNNIIVGGDLSQNNRDGFVNKYDANGVLLWSIIIGGSNKDVVYGVKTDAQKSVYVTGYFENTVDFDPGAGTYTLTSSGGRDIFLAKYDSSGAFRWAFKMGGPLSVAYEEGGRDIAISGPNVYLTGNFEGTSDFNPGASVNNLTSNGSLDMFVAKYDTTGSYLWAISMGSNNKHDYSYGIDIDAAENVYITGGFEETVDFDPSAGTYTLSSASVNAQDIFVAKYNQAAAFQWAFQVGGNTAVDDHAFDIDVTPAGDIFICGEVWGPADFDPSPAINLITPSNDQIFFARYSSSGSFGWAFDIGATSGNGSADNGFGVHATNSGMLYVTGDFSGTADFNPGPGTATLSSIGGDAFLAVYGTSIVSAINETETSDKPFVVYPNPASDMVTFHNTEFANIPWSLAITDIAGKLILNIASISMANHVVNTGKLSPGVYFCNMKSGDKSVTRKLIVKQ